MSGPRWDEEMKFELLRLRSEMRSENFRVLATPLGLGRISVPQTAAKKSLYPVLRTPSSLKPPRPAPADSSRETAASPQSQAMMPISALEQLQEGTATQKRRSFLPQTRLGRMLHPLSIHMLDLGFVLLCLGMGLVVLGFILDPTQMSWRPEQLAQALPIQMLQRLQAWTLIVGVYLIFGLYWLFFKIVSGHTLGESLWPKFSAADKEVAAAPDNASGET